jgi:zinc protease
VCIGFPTVPRSSPHWPAIEVVNRVLGGAYSSRINLNIREDKGYSYNIRSALAENRGAGELYIRGTIVIDKTVPAVVEVLKELDRLRSQPPTDAELESGKALAIGLATRLETNAQLGDVVTRAIVFGLPLDHLARYVEEVRALTRDQALEAANAYFGAARASIVVLGPAARLRESLSAAGFGPVEKP